MFSMCIQLLLYYQITFQCYLFTLVTWLQHGMLSTKIMEGICSDDFFVLVNHVTITVVYYRKERENHVTKTTSSIFTSSYLFIMKSDVF